MRIHLFKRYAAPSARAEIRYLGSVERDYYDYSWMATTARRKCRRNVGPFITVVEHGSFYEVIYFPNGVGEDREQIALTQYDLEAMAEAARRALEERAGGAEA